MLQDALRARMFAAIKSGDTLEKEILRVALGEITTDAARENRKGDDQEASAILRKLIKSNEESLSQTQDPNRRVELEREIQILEEFLPRRLGLEEIVALLEPIRDELRAAKSDGQATGLAIKHLRAAKADVDGKATASAVQQIRTA